MANAPPYPDLMPHPDPISREEAARILGISLSRLAEYARRSYLIRERNEVTRRVTYSKSQVEDLRRRREQG